MRKILIIGSGCAGKSFFSRRLHDLTGLPLVHLDKLYWQPNWVEPSKEEWEQTVRKILEKNEWILDGNFGGTMEMRMQVCDTIIWLDLPAPTCFYRALKRNLKYYGKVRPDMGEGCYEKLDVKFLWWILTFKQNKSGTKLKTLVEKFRDTKNIIWLKSDREVEKFLSNSAKKE